MAIVIILLPRLDPNKEFSDYARRGRVVDWLTSVLGETTCDVEMEAVSKEVLDKATSKNQPDLFLNH